MFPRAILTLFFLIGMVFANTTEEFTEKIDKNIGRSYLTLLEEKLELKFEEYAGYFTKWLENFNDRNLGNTELGRLLHYEDIKPKLESQSRKQSGRMKKMTMAMMPLIFHMGATSTWMMLTSIMAAKSVAIGLALLMFKIAVSSVKLASFFTQLKSKHSDHGWAWSPPPHGHDRSFKDNESYHDHPPPADWHSYSPEWTPNEVQPRHPHEYHTIPVGSYKSDDLEPYHSHTDKKYS